jgi:hypothetical protein
MRKSMHEMECSFTLPGRRRRSPWDISIVPVGNQIEYGRPTHCVSEAHTCVQIVRFCARWLQSAFIIHRFQVIIQRMVFFRSQPVPRSR